ncbi:methylenetetrahydrofolate reductase C-terminal domain-containing protein [Pelotomaculum terephthalicicum JT]|uniref:methylenetetrahydrofolate reductase C-terminal domain-containing protein n=1 Tax=Pelotomaculum TaxID=191373 RepID=UPI001F03AE8F|nr:MULTISPECIES: methylenetetrahydrofolate reductase C-terminal domain-containing protein [Pelotomaculum]MCG9969317.1 methylenetetrahydrofolate reductase C-terminal domain-containing protein [Pelotomaculum terephthalicicum JT]
MIIAEQKPIAEIAGYIENCNKVLLVGCGGCVTVCLTGGEKETGILASALRIKRRLEGRPLETVVCVVTRQCEPEYIDALDSVVRDVDAIISLACGIGPQYLAGRYKDKYVVPAMNTRFAGGAKKHGVWEEYCGLCGDCVLSLTGGICPVIRCAKSILNGPCGGSQNGKCEIDRDVDCAWQLIHDRLKILGRLDTLKEIVPPKDWSRSRDGGPRKMVIEEVRNGSNTEEAN